MLDSGKKHRPLGETKVVTVIGQGTHVTGELKSQGTVRVEGLVSGHMECEDTIVVQEGGRVEADIEAAQIVISGEVRGNVFAHDRLEITANGKLLGDITAPRVSIAEGVLFEGKCTMKPPSEAKLRKPKAPDDPTTVAAAQKSEPPKQPQQQSQQPRQETIK
jgi:cytoskeletal protein CcmA (bactofilin family)